VRHALAKTRVTELKVQTQKTCVETGSVTLTSDQFIILTQSISRISGRAHFLHQRDVADQTYIYSAPIGFGAIHGAQLHTIRPRICLHQNLQVLRLHVMEWGAAVQLPSILGHSYTLGKLKSHFLRLGRKYRAVNLLTRAARQASLSSTACSAARNVSYSHTCRTIQSYVHLNLARCPHNSCERTPGAHVKRSHVHNICSG
jgi:hypothetical protein